MTTTTVYPATVQDLIRSAADQGVEPSELLATLPTPPAGFVQQADALQPDILSDFFDGPTFQGDGWRITTHWEAEAGVSFYVDEINGNAVPVAQAGKIAAVLAEVAAMAG